MNICTDCYRDIHPDRIVPAPVKAAECRICGDWALIAGPRTVTTLVQPKDEPTR